MIREQNNNPAINRYLELETKTLLQTAPRDADKLKAPLQVKERQNEEATHIEDTERLVTERLKCSRLYSSTWYIEEE
jgi:hypothetical protein